MLYHTLCTHIDIEIVEKVVHIFKLCFRFTIQKKKKVKLPFNCILATICSTIFFNSF